LNFSTQVHKVQLVMVRMEEMAREVSLVVLDHLASLAHKEPWATLVTVIHLLAMRQLNHVKLKDRQ